MLQFQIHSVRWLGLLLLCALPLAAVAAGEAPVVAAAGGYAARLDSGDFSGAWTRLDELGRRLEDPALWLQRQAAIRAAYGALHSRTLRSVTQRGSYMHHPDGAYVIVSFDARFEHKALAVETVVVRVDSDGQPAVIAYIIN